LTSYDSYLTILSKFGWMSKEKEMFEHLEIKKSVCLTTIFPLLALPNIKRPTILPILVQLWFKSTIGYHIFYDKFSKNMDRVEREMNRRRKNNISPLNIVDNR